MPWVFVLIWSTGFIGAKYGLPYAEPLTFLLWRFALVAGLLLALALVLRAPWPRTAACTACHTDDWFSHRAEKGKTGRFGALISLASR